VNIFYPGTHIYVRDRLANKTFLASQITESVQTQAGGGNGCGEGAPQTVKKCKNGTTTCDLNNPAVYNLEPVMVGSQKRISAAVLNYDGAAPDSRNPRISGNGQFLVSDTNASNLGGMDSNWRSRHQHRGGCIPGAGLFRL
jgi:hypothetical protein